MLGRPSFELSGAELLTLAPRAISAAAAAGDKWTLAQIEKRFAPLRTRGDDSKIHADLVGAVLVQSVRHGGRAEYDTVLRVYHNPPTSTHKTAAMTALSSVTQPELVKRTVAVHERYRREWPALAERYRAALKDITSPEAWDETFRPWTGEDESSQSGLPGEKR